MDFEWFAALTTNRRGIRLRPQDYPILSSDDLYVFYLSVGEPVSKALVYIWIGRQANEAHPYAFKHISSKVDCCCKHTKMNNLFPQKGGIRVETVLKTLSTAEIDFIEDLGQFFLETIEDNRLIASTDISQRIEVLEGEEPTFFMAMLNRCVCQNQGMPVFEGDTTEVTSRAFGLLVDGEIYEVSDRSIFGEYDTTSATCIKRDVFDDGLHSGKCFIVIKPVRQTKECNK